MNEKEIFLDIEERLISEDKPSIYLENALKNHNL